MGTYMYTLWCTCSKHLPLGVQLMFFHWIACFATNVTSSRKYAGGLTFGFCNIVCTTEFVCKWIWSLNVIVVTASYAFVIAEADVLHELKRKNMFLWRLRSARWPSKGDVWGQTYLIFKASAGALSLCECQMISVVNIMQGLELGMENHWMALLPLTAYHNFWVWLFIALHRFSDVSWRPKASTSLFYWDCPGHGMLARLVFVFGRSHIGLVQRRNIARFTLSIFVSYQTLTVRRPFLRLQWALGILVNHTSQITHTVGIRNYDMCLHSLPMVCFGFGYCYGASAWIQSSDKRPFWCCRNCCWFLARCKVASSTNGWLNKGGGGFSSRCECRWWKCKVQIVCHAEQDASHLMSTTCQTCTCSSHRAEQPVCTTCMWYWYVRGFSLALQAKCKMGECRELHEGFDWKL